MKILSYFLLIPPLCGAAYNLACRKIVAYDSFRYKTSSDSSLTSRFDVISTKDCQDTLEWRKRLISVAEHNIVISGNYCGGHAFDDLLHCIQERMNSVPTLQVVIIAHPKFILNSSAKGIKNKKLISAFKSKYGERFQLVHSPDSWLGTKKITNHTKCTVIDFGRYFIQGGSGIRDSS